MSGSDDPATAKAISAAGADVTVDKDNIQELPIHLDD